MPERRDRGAWATQREAHTSHPCSSQGSRGAPGDVHPSGPGRDGGRCARCARMAFHISVGPGTAVATSQTNASHACSPAAPTTTKMAKEAKQKMEVRKLVEGKHEPRLLISSMTAERWRATMVLGPAGSVPEVAPEPRPQKSVSKVAEDFATLRTGRADPRMLDRIEVEYYGAMTPLNGVAAVSVADATTLSIQPYDLSALAAIGGSASPRLRPSRACGSRATAGRPSCLQSGPSWLRTWASRLATTARSSACPSRP